MNLHERDVFPIGLDLTMQHVSLSRQCDLTWYNPVDIRELQDFIPAKKVHLLAPLATLISLLGIIFMLEKTDCAARQSAMWSIRVYFFLFWRRNVGGKW